MFCERQRDRRPPPRSLMRTPPTSTVPPVGVSSPPMRLSSVVLPEPDGPISARKSPAGISRFTFRNTSMRSEPRVKCFCTPAIRTSMSPIRETPFRGSGLGTRTLPLDRDGHAVLDHGRQRCHHLLTPRDPCHHFQ